jgi:hypothetical protein
MLHLAFCIACGKPAFNRRVLQAPTFYLALEGRSGIDKRVYGMCKSMAVETAEFGYSGTPIELLQVDRGRTCMNQEYIASLVAVIRKYKFKFIIIDTLNLTLGGADENSNSDMGLLMKAASEIVMSTGVHVAFVAHSAKAGIDGGPRGGGAQKGNADLVVSVSGEKNLMASCFPPAGKIKDGTAFKLHFKLKVEDLAHDDDGDAVTTCVVEETEASPDRLKKELSPAQRQAFQEICDLFSEPTATVDVAPEATMSSRPCVAPKQVNDKWIETGRLDSEGKTSGAVQKEGQRLRNSLRDLGKIGINSRYIWLVDRVDSGGQQADMSI